ncbi:MAG: lamin tail domain-containing protein [Bacteroidota bacterium]
MVKNRIFIALYILIIFQVSCKKVYDSSDADIVINELMAINNSIAADQNGEYDDWIELFNKTSATIDISGYYLTDSKNNLSKWQMPVGTSIVGNGYLIVWADKDTTQTGLHTNFKLSSLGERVIFLNPHLAIVDQVEYPAQTLQLSYSRVPDGTGPFVWQIPTFSSSNDQNK